MVLDPFSALSLTGNIVQLVDFSGRVVAHVVELYKSSSGLIKEHIELSASARSLKQTANTLSKEFSQNGASPAEQQPLRDLIAACEGLADDLIRSIEDLTVDPKNRRWSIMRQTARAVSRKTVVHELVMRVGRVRDALNSHLLTTLRYDYDELLGSICRLT